MQRGILEGFATPAQFGKQIRRSKRTVERMMQRREVVFTSLGRMPLIDIPATLDFDACTRN